MSLKNLCKHWLTLARCMTHMYIFEAKFVSTYLQIKDFPRQMCVLCVNTPGILPPRMNLDVHGICGFVKPKERYQHTVVDPDVQSLWITYNWM